jgi:hypothetical protein
VTALTPFGRGLDGVFTSRRGYHPFVQEDTFCFSEVKC